MKKEPYEVVIWGDSTEYDRYARSFAYEIAKGNMKIKAITFNEEGIMGCLDGITLVPIDELIHIDFDYLIDMNDEEEEQTVLHILELLHIPRDKRIPARVFLLPAFDIKKWVKVKENRVSLISNNCWGGMTYHSLELQFLSPFINLFVLEEDYLKLLENLQHYMQCPLHFVEERYEDNLKRNYPVMALEDICLHFNHYESVEEAVTYWNKRKTRLNADAMLVEMLIKTPEGLERFLALPFPHKIGFTYLKCEHKDIISFADCVYYQEKYRDKDKDWKLILNQANGIKGGDRVEELTVTPGKTMRITKDSEECKIYDVLKLLNFEDDYRRIW